MKRGRFFVAVCLLGASAQAATWSDLWVRPDQRAQSLLDAGHAAEAAPMFDDPQRRAYAEIKAQQYADAAKRLAPLQEPDAQYNRGNALARGGELKDALQAYEAALKKAPHDTPLYRDAEHNRDLVAKQLQKQQSQSGQGGQDQNKSAQNQGQQQGQDQRGEQNKGTDGNQSPQQSGSGQSAQDQASKDKASQAQSGQGQEQREAQTKPGSKDARDANSAAKPEGENGRQAQDSAAAAEADARAAMQSAQDQAKAGARATPSGQGTRTPDAQGKRVADADVEPESEQALALDQWLRWIPDDPAGLLRRKFVIEHMMKQREAQQ